MRRSITSPKIKQAARKALAIAFWLGVWQWLSAAVGEAILLVSPLAAVRALFALMGTQAFYAAVFGSFGRILAGFALALAAGLLLAALSFLSPFVRALLAPLMTAVKATPVASIVILALIWISSRNLSIFISFLMVLPVVYTNVFAGLLSADKKLLEMAAVFRVRGWRRARAIYLPAMFPYLLSACRSSLGMCWKAGVAAEVIGQPDASIGDALYRAKVFFATEDLFAWTLAIVLLSVLFEHLVMLGIRALQRRLEGAA